MERGELGVPAVIKAAGRSLHLDIREGKFARLEQTGRTYLRGYRDGGCDQPNLYSWNSEFAALHKLTRYDLAVRSCGGDIRWPCGYLPRSGPQASRFFGRSCGRRWLGSPTSLKSGSTSFCRRTQSTGWRVNIPVPFDASTSNGLAVPIRGLGPRTHRMQSLGHDPFLGWLFGVRDVLMGKFTAIGSDGQIVIPVHSRWGARRVRRRFCSSRSWKRLNWWPVISCPIVATRAGLPPPLFGLAPVLSARGNRRPIPSPT